MPTYGYHCGRCGHEFEVRQSMADAPLKACPECGGELRKLLYPVGVQFKGSGFYTTDYNRSGRDSSKSSDKGSETSDKGSEGKSESGSSPSSNGSETKTSSSGSSEKNEKKTKTEPAPSKE
jgi:putative FmdB family regulatory protein